MPPIPPRCTPSLRAGLAVALLVGGCTPLHVYEPPDWSLRLERDSGFDSAAMLDATHVVFSWSDGRYRRVAPDPLWWKGGREYVRDQKRIGIYDVAAGTGRIVHEERKDRLGDGNGDLSITAARGGFAVVFRDRATENGILVDAGGWFLLDLGTGGLARVDLGAALDPRSLELAGAPTLAGDEGTVLVRARAARGNGWRPAKPHDREANSADAELLLLKPDGAVFDLGVGRLLGQASGRVFVGRAGRDGAEAFDIRTGEMRELSNDELDERRAVLHESGPATVAVANDGASLRLSTDPTRQAEIAFDVEALL